MNILFVGGGSGGPVTPLLAIARYLQQNAPDASFHWIGGLKGPEKRMVTAANIPFSWTFSGKLRRYFSWRNFIDPILIFIGIIQSLLKLRKIKPDVMVSAGSFFAVPVGIAAWILRIPILIHQQDIRPSLTNKILSKFAKLITVNFNPSLEHFPKNKTIRIGNPVRSEVLLGDKLRAKELFNLETDTPVILIIGGGTGALKINQLTISALPELLSFCQVIHITGSGKKLPPLAIKEKAERYHSFEFLNEQMPDALAAADLVITRAGTGFLTELSALGKPTIIIPIPNSQQVDNAEYFAKLGAAIQLNQENLSSQNLVADIKELINDKQALEFLSHQIKRMYEPNATAELAEAIISLKS